MKVANCKGKKHTLSLLTPNWREQIFANLHSIKLKTAVAVLSATGCRPCELEQGVILAISEGVLVIVICGSKLNILQKRGQAERSLVVSRQTPWGAFLSERLSLYERNMLVTYDAGGISQRLREKSRELWPRRKTLVSAYSYRHFIGRSMKESGEPSEKIAYTLGHASDYSQAKYGRAGGRKSTAGAHGIIFATASEPIRHSPKTDRLQRFNADMRMVEDNNPI